ncbi:MAG: nucleotidyltransferase family protein [bacterium]|nr:nucleotidyltransferase family protein [bacterium]
MQAVILAAGKGLRLRPFTEHHPKPLIPVAGKPLLHYTIETLPEAVTEIIIVIGYLGEQIIENLGDNWEGKPITYVNQPDLSGTGNALLMAKPLLRGQFLVVNGDDLYSKEDLTDLAKHSYSILAWQSQKTYEYGLAINEEMQLIGFDVNASLLNCGAYALNCDFFNYPLATIEVHGKTEYSLPHTLINIADKEKVMVVKATHWFPVGTPAQLDFANSYYIRTHI